MKKFKTQYKSLLSIEKRLDELIEQECKRTLSKKEDTEFIKLRNIARLLRVKENNKNEILELRKRKLEKIKNNMGI